MALKKLLSTVFVFSLLVVGLSSPSRAQNVRGVGENFTSPITGTNIAICDFYRDKSAEMNCSPNGYLERFGYRYCRSFIKKERKLTVGGAHILASIRSCLIETLREHPSLTCANVKKEAERSHVPCYIEAGYCGLGVMDRWVIASTVWKEMTDRDFRFVAYDIDAACAGQPAR